MKFPGTYSTYRVIDCLLPKIMDKAKELSATSLAIPLLGTGAGRLNPIKVLDLYQKHLTTDDLKVVIVTPCLNSLHQIEKRVTYD